MEDEPRDRLVLRSGRIVRYGIVAVVLGNLCLVIAFIFDIFRAPGLWGPVWGIAALVLFPGVVRDAINYQRLPALVAAEQSIEYFSRARSGTVRSEWIKRVTFVEQGRADFVEIRLVSGQLIRVHVELASTEERVAAERAIARLGYAS